MSCSLWLQFRSLLCKRRHGRSELVFLLSALGGPLLVVMGFSAYDGGQYCFEQGWPLDFIIFGAVIFWIQAGIPVQLRLSQDRGWQGFVRHMPIGPGAQIAVHIRAGILVNFIAALLVFCGLWGAEVNWWAVQGIVRWIVILTAIFWALSIQISIGLMAAKFDSVIRIIFLFILIDSLFTIGRIILTASDAPGGNGDINHIISTDPLLFVSGMAALTQTLTAPIDLLWPKDLICSAHLAGAATLMFMICRYSILRASSEKQQRSLAVFYTRWVKRAIGCLFPGPRGGQITIEWLRTLRCQSVIITFFALGGAILGIVFRMQQRDSGFLGFLIILAFLVVSNASELLKQRKGNRLYNLYAADSKHYLYGFFTSIGFFVSVLILVLIPIFNQDINWSVAALVFCVSSAMGFGLVGMTVWLDDYCSSFKCPNGMGAAFLYLFRIVFASLPCLLFALLFTLLGTYNVILPLIFAVVMLIAEVKRTQRRSVEDIYWKLSDG